MMTLPLSPEDICPTCKEAMGDTERVVVVVAGKDLNGPLFDGAEMYRVASFHVEHAPPEPSE